MINQPPQAELAQDDLKLLKIASLYKKLRSTYPGTKVKNATNFCTQILAKVSTVTDIPRYQKIYRDVFCFYVLCSHNTRDELTARYTSKLVAHLEQKNYLYDLNEFEPFFQKHNKRNVEAIKKITLLFDQNNFYSGFQLLKIPGIGFKSMALIYNEFVTSGTYPVVDVNVLKAARSLLPTLEDTANADRFFLLLLKLDSNHCGLPLPYEVMSALYYYRKEVCLKKSCSRGLPCTVCEALMVK